MNAWLIYLTSQQLPRPNLLEITAFDMWYIKVAQARLRILASNAASIPIALSNQKVPIASGTHSFRGAAELEGRLSHVGGPSRLADHIPQSERLYRCVG